MPDPPDPDASDRLLGLSEVADLLQTSRTTVANWRARRGNFPAPVADLKSGPIWRQADVLDWADAEGVQVVESEPAAEPTNDGPGAKTVAVMNAKGGVGKSTLAANLGWYLAHQRNQRVLMVDLDPQFNLSQYVLGTAKYEAHLQQGKGTVLDVFEQATPTSVSKKERKAVSPSDVISRVKSWSDGSRIDLLPSSLELSWTVLNATGKEQLLANFLDQVRGAYDTIVIDCAPTESILTRAAYLATDKVLIPVKPEFLATVGLPLLVRSLSDFKSVYRQPVDVMGIVFNMTMANGEHQRSKAYVRKEAANNCWDVFESEVSYSDSYPKGSRLGKPIFLTDYARAYRISNFVSVAEEFVARLSA
ncbi:MAG: AAA family ATPase [Actinomycetota bacterium]|nr:AAA family ATPase [Actinomycetota bacterium]